MGGQAHNDDNNKRYLRYKVLLIELSKKNKDQLLATVFHKLGTLLNGILGDVGFLRWMM